MSPAGTLAKVSAHTLQEPLSDEEEAFSCSWALILAFLGLNFGLLERSVGNEYGRYLHRRPGRRLVQGRTRD